jgi:TDG/mug DNA glycosylase family protein
MILPDLVTPDMRVVFCGTAAGGASARAGAYYAGRGNRFWRILHETGLTPRLLRPQDFNQLPALGIGLTDVSKTASGMDHEIEESAFDPQRLQRVIEEAAPKAIAFNGKKAARVAFGLRSTQEVDYGLQRQAFGGSLAWVLPSTSGAANRSWSSLPWYDLAASLGVVSEPASRRKSIPTPRQPGSAGSGHSSQDVRSRAAGSMKLHEAIDLVLGDAGRPLTAQEIAHSINERRLYIRPTDGRPLGAAQVRSRISTARYRDSYEVKAGLISRR